jgi:phage-related protein
MALRSVVRVHEIRVRDEAGAFRLMCVAKFPEAIYVLHAFQKKARTTTRRDLALARDRYQEVLMRRKLLLRPSRVFGTQSKTLRARPLA